MYCRSVPAPGQLGVKALGVSFNRHLQELVVKADF